MAIRTTYRVSSGMGHLARATMLRSFGKTACPGKFHHLATHSGLMKIQSVQKVRFSSQQAERPKNPPSFSFLDFAVGLAFGSCATAGLFFMDVIHKKEPAPKNDHNGLIGRLQPYFELLDKHPQVLGPLGTADKGEIEIIRDVGKIAEIEKETGQKVGILGENKWQMWVCDAVKFPNGTYGVFGRFFWKQSLKGPSGAAVLPLLPDGKFLLICIYRHSLRKWAIEIPRGNGEGAEMLKALIRRELKEETGAEVSETVELGKINADSGITLGGIPLVLAKVSKFGSHKRDDAETSISLIALTPSELDAAIKKGSLSVKINGEYQEVEIGRDSFTLAALKLYDLYQGK